MKKQPKKKSPPKKRKVGGNSKKRPKKSPKKIEGVAKRILADLNGEKKKRKIRPTRAKLERMVLGLKPIPIKEIFQFSIEELPGFAYAFDTKKRGRLLRLGIGSAYVEMEEQFPSDKDPEEILRKYSKFHISLDTSVYPLKKRNK